MRARSCCRSDEKRRSIGRTTLIGFEKFPNIQQQSSYRESTDPTLSLLTMALRVLPVGTAYAVWTGIGAAGTALVGMYWLGDGVSFWRLFWIGLILVSVAGLHWSA
ncbi:MULTISPECIES: DMT family transporter [Pseudomonas]|uniref:DMT family transporter n=1 Tax=Pseudomonas TaxID=286 RepID=UPI0021D4139A|nr:MULTISPECIES: multidrug efflux SMR transporter [Pseudomonas]